MRVVFEDLDGRRGEVSEDLVVHYDGRWRSAVTDCVERLRSERAGTPGDKPIHVELVVELPEEAPIVEIECVDGADDPDG